MLREQLVYEGELKALRTIEGVVRRFLTQFREEPLWTWPPHVVRMAQAAQANLQLVELARIRQGTAPPVPLEELPAEVGVFLEMPGEEAYELTAEQTRLLSLYHRLPEERRAFLLAFFEQDATPSAAQMEGLEL